MSRLADIQAALAELKASHAAWKRATPAQQREYAAAILASKRQSKDLLGADSALQSFAAWSAERELAELQGNQPWLDTVEDLEYEELSQPRDLSAWVEKERTL